MSKRKWNSLLKEAPHFELFFNLKLICYSDSSYAKLSEELGYKLK